jgi:hypothetical protein
MISNHYYHHYYYQIIITHTTRMRVWQITHGSGLESRTKPGPPC